MTFEKIFPRKLHQQRADRLEARFSPTWTGDSATETVLPNGPASPAPAPAAPPSRPPPPAQPAPPTTPSAAAPPVRPTPSVPPPVPATTPTVVAPVVPTTSSSLVVPTTTPSSIIVQTTPTLVATPTSKVPTLVSTPTTFKSLPQTNPITISSASSASPTSTAASSTSMSTGSIVGIAAGGIAGVALVGALGIWVLKRWFNSREHDDTSGNGGGFNRHSWMRNSVALADDATSPIVRGGMGHPSENPRPPTMIERKQTQNYANVASSRGQYGQYGQYGQEQYGQYGQNGHQRGYSDYQDSPYPAPPPMPSFNPGQHFNNGAPSPNSAQGFFSPISPPPLSPGMASMDDTMPPVQHASPVPTYFSRHDSNMSAAQPDSAALPDMPNPHGDGDGYAKLDRTSVTPYQAQQYAEISRQLDEPLPAVSEAEHAPHAQTMEQVPRSVPTQAHPPAVSPFDDPMVAPYQELPLPAPVHPRVDSTPPTLPPMRAMSPVASGGGANPSFSQLTHAFPAAPTSPVHPAFPPAVAGSPRAAAFPASSKSATPPPLSPGVGPQKGQVVTVPDIHVGRETPVQFGFTQPAHAPVPAAAKVPSRPETMYDEEDAYGGI